MPISVKNFQLRLSQWEKESNLPQNKFADSIGIKYMTYRNILNGTRGPHLETLVEISKKVGIDKCIWLLTGESSPETGLEISAGEGVAPEQCVSIAPRPILNDLDNLFATARQRAESDPEFAVWLKVEIKKALE